MSINIYLSTQKANWTPSKSLDSEKTFTCLHPHICKLIKFLSECFHILVYTPPPPPINSSINPAAHSFIHSFVCLSLRSFVHSLINSLPFMHSFVHPCVPSFVHSLIQSIPFTHSFVRLCVHSFIHSFMSVALPLFITTRLNELLSAEHLLHGIISHPIYDWYVQYIFWFLSLYHIYECAIHICWMRRGPRGLGGSLWTIGTFIKCPICE